MDNTWRKPSRCDNSGPNCAQVRRTAGGTVQIRNSQRPDAVVEFTEDEWRAFTPVADTEFAV